MAVHGADILEAAQQVNTLPDALVGCQRAIATTARARTLPTPQESPKAALPWLLADGITSALIFGPEDRGLSNLELNYAQRFVCIPASAEYSSLNLAQAVAVCCYELFQIARQPALPAAKTPVAASSTTDMVSLEVLENYYQHLEAVLLKIGYLYPHTATARMEKFRHLFNRAAPTTAEVMMLRGILRQMEWALKFQPKSVTDGDSDPNQS
jgi:tRNA/rRNA methyltransferase